MITFSCTHCGRTFVMSEEFAGRTGRCKQCGTTIVVPSTGPALPPHVAVNALQKPEDPLPRGQPASAPERRISVRMRRLAADAAQVQAAFGKSSLIQVLAMSGEPPEVYRVQYNIKGLVRNAQGKLVCREQHLAEIQLTRDYPRQSPKCRMLTPIFHPNIEPAVICVGDHWTAGERLVDLIVRIGEMIAFQAYNVKSPLDGEAAMWADLHQDRLPIDGRSLQPAEPG